MKSPWLTARLEGLTGTDAAAILGLSPWRTPLAVWASKTGRLADEDISDRQHIRWGNLLEPVVVAETLRRSRRRAVSFDEWGRSLPGGRLVWLRHGETQKAMVFSKRYPWLRVTPDFALGAWTPLPWAPDATPREGPGVGEAKAVGLHAGKDWREAPPLYYQAQVACNALACGLSWGCFGVLIGGQRHEVMDFGVSDDLAASLAERLERFWHEHILADRPPEPTGDDQDRSVLERLFPGRKTAPPPRLEGGSWAIVARELDRLRAEAAALRAKEREIKQRAAALENQLRLALGDAPAAELDSGARLELRTVERRGHTVAPKKYRELRLALPPNPEPEPKP